MGKRPFLAPHARAGQLRGALWRGFLAAYLLGGLFCGYLFYASVRDIVANPRVPRPEDLAWQEEAIGSDLPGSPQDVALAEEPGPAPDQPVNILLLGIDERAGEEGPSRSDTMILFSIDAPHRRIAMLSIPRDLWVPLPPGLPYSHDDRVNTAHAYGDYYGYPGGGPALAKRTVQYNLGVPVHYYVRVNFAGFERIIDEIGGIEVDVPREIVDTEYPVRDNLTTTVRFMPGRQVMNGARALMYARTRHDRSDIERMQRQQQIIMAVRAKVLRLNTLIALLPRLPAVLRGFVQTDMPPSRVLAVARLAYEVREENVERGVIDGSMVIPWEAPGGAQVLVPRREEIRKLVGELFPLPAQAAQASGAN